MSSPVFEGEEGVGYPTVDGLDDPRQTGVGLEVGEDVRLLLVLVLDVVERGLGVEVEPAGVGADHVHHQPHEPGIKRNLLHDSLASGNLGLSLLLGPLHQDGGVREVQGVHLGQPLGIG